MILKSHLTEKKWINKLLYFYHNKAHCIIWFLSKRGVSQMFKKMWHILKIKIKIIISCNYNFNKFCLSTPSHVWTIKRVRNLNLTALYRLISACIRPRPRSRHSPTDVVLFRSAEEENSKQLSYGQWILNNSKPQLNG